MRRLDLIKSGVGQADTGQTTVVYTPAFAKYASFYLQVVAATGTTPLTDFVMYAAHPAITAAAVVATSTAGDGTHDEIQTVTLTGGPTFGTWTLSFSGVSGNITTVTTDPIKCDATGAELQELLNRALPTSGTYKGQDIVPVRTGSGTSGAPYVYTLTFSGPSVAKTNVDAVTVSGLALATYTTDTALGIAGWDGITQIAGTTAGSVVVNVGPGVTGIADDDTGPVYNLNTPLPSAIAYKLLFDRTTGNEIETWSLYADWSS